MNVQQEGEKYKTTSFHQSKKRKLTFGAGFYCIFYNTVVWHYFYIQNELPMQSAQLHREYNVDIAPPAGLTPYSQKKLTVKEFMCSSVSDDRSTAQRGVI